MGNAPSVIRSVLGRDHSSVETVALSPSSIYKWPPKIGNYFASYFIMGGQKFDTPQPEAYLFGDNNDLNFLGNRPVPFPYPLTSQPNEPTRTLQSLVNVRKDTLRLVKCDLPASDGASAAAASGPVAAAAATDSPATAADSSSTVNVVDDCQNGTALSTGAAGSTPAPAQRYNLEFVFDSDAPCVITILYFAKEEVGNGVVMYQPQDPSMTSRGYPYKSGANQAFSQPEHCIQPCKFSDSDWLYSSEKDEIPVVIHCAVDNNEPMLHAHITFAAIEKTSDGYSIKAIKQKQLVDGLAYILQEFYGIENKEPGGQESDGDDLDDNTSECVICMSDVRDTLILPCRHLCLCNGCADSLRYQASSCPICRSPFHALLQIRAIRKKASAAASSSTTAAAASAGTTAAAGDSVAAVAAVAAVADEDEESGSGVSQKDVPAGYEAVSLIEALNGAHRRPPASGVASGEAPASSSTKSARRSSSSAEASLRRSRGSRQKQPSGDSSTAARRNKSRTGVPSCISASANRESAATIADEQQHHDGACNAAFAAADDVEAGPTSLEASAACNTVAVQTDEMRLATEDSMTQTRVNECVSRSDSNAGLNVVSTLERVRMRDEDTDSGIPDDLTEDSRTTADDLSAPELRRVTSTSGMTRMLAAAVGRSSAQRELQAHPPADCSSGDVAAIDEVHVKSSAPEACKMPSDE